MVHPDTTIGQQLTDDGQDVLGMIGVPLEQLLPEISVHVQRDTRVFAGSFEGE